MLIDSGKVYGTEAIDAGCGPVNLFLPLCLAGLLRQRGGYLLRDRVALGNFFSKGFQANRGFGFLQTQARYIALEALHRLIVLYP